MVEQHETQKLISQKVLHTAIMAGDYVRANAFRIGHIAWKRLDDPVTNLDKEAERMICNEFLGVYGAGKDKPQDGKGDSGTLINFIGEEYGLIDRGGRINLYIDPIDGTKSFIRREFKSSVSIAAEEKGGRIIAACVYDFMRGIAYFTAHDTPAHIYIPHSGERISMPLESPGLSKLTILCDDESRYRHILEPEHSVGLNHPTGSVALQMAQLAAGTYDAMILKPHKKKGITDISDLIAGYALLRDTHAIILDQDLNEFDHHNPHNGMVAITKDAYEQVMGLIAGHGGRNGTRTIPYKTCTEYEQQVL